MEEEKLLHVLRLCFLLFITFNASANDTKLYVFVSSSMGKFLLQNYVSEAEIHNATLVFNGLVNGSFKDLGHLVSDIIGDKNTAIIIDDNLYEKYSINKVPAFVLISEYSNIYDKISGNIGIHTALEIFREKGAVLK